MRRSRRAVALATALVLMPICMMAVYVFLHKLMTSVRHSSEERGQSQAFQMCEAGLTVAYDAFQANNFWGTTHTLKEGSLVPTTGSDALVVPAGTLAFAPAGDGWQQWSWHPGEDPQDCFCNGQAREVLRFRCYRPSDSTWRIDCEATVGSYKKTHTLQGQVENNAEYALFAAGDLEDLTKADPVLVRGKVHANGNIYLMPRFMTNWSPTLDCAQDVPILGTQWIRNVNWPIVVAVDPARDPKDSLHHPPVVSCDIETDDLEAGGEIVRHASAHGEGYTTSGQTITSTGRVTLKPTTGPGAAVEMQGGAAGVAFDSKNPNWKRDAWTKFGKIVRDRQLGSRIRDSFDPRATVPTPEGFYYRQAEANGLLLTRASLTGSHDWLKESVFWNNSENRRMRVLDVDVARLGASSDWPGNGLLYSDSPIRLSNAQKLKGPLTVVSCAPIYTKGSFNVDVPEPGLGNQKKPAALVTTDRLYHLSANWYDDPNPRPGVQEEAHKEDDPPIPPTQFPPHAGQPDGPAYAAAGVPDPNRNTLVINADLVDGVPVLHELNWVKEHEGQHNPFYDINYYWPNNVYPRPPRHSYRGHRWQAAVNCAAGTDCLLEEFHQLQMVMDEPTHWDSRASLPDNPDNDFQPVTFVRTGSVMHLQCATMGPFTDQPKEWEEAPGVTPWMVRSYYTPWIRQFNSEPMFQPGPNRKLPVFAPNVSSKTLWLGHAAP